MSLETYFEKFRKNIIGENSRFELKNGEKRIVYADWTASGRLYEPIEKYISSFLGPYVANTHTETTLTGTTMTDAYHQAQQIIKKHANASKDDVIITAGAGMTAVINKFQRILGLKVPEKFKGQIKFEENDKPLVIITHMEHHSNQTSWVECLCDVEIINRLEDGKPDLNHLKEILEKNKNRSKIIGSFTSCSNVTGIITPYHKMAAMVHEYGGIALIDFAASAPYVEINMHPSDPKEKLDAIFFSPHKFLGGPGSSGVVIFDKALYELTVPDHPGGGTVMWTNPWGEHKYFDDIEAREDGGTPGFLQCIKTSLAILLKEEMGVDNILEREKELKDLLINGLKKNPFIHILEPEQNERLGIVSFYSLDKHHNLIVKLLNDYFGVQTRGGCSCAGTYGHILLNVDYNKSQKITDKINIGDLTDKPGWIRISIHPTMANSDVEYIVNAVHSVLENYDQWKIDYEFQANCGEFSCKSFKEKRISLRDTFNAY
jgi:selenocysteine lyase/cysteine desulfurase